MTQSPLVPASDTNIWALLSPRPTCSSTHYLSTMVLMNVQSQNQLRRSSLAALASVMLAIMAPLPVVGEDTAEGIEYFEKNIRPLLAARCYNCHSSREQKREGGLLLDTRAGWEAGGDNGPAIVPGDVEASRLIQAIRYTDSSLSMPPDKQLPPDEIVKLEYWVRMGAPDPRDEDLPASAALANPSDPIAGRQHWAFQPLQDPHLPNIKFAAWPGSAIDAFVLSKLEDADLMPSPAADKRILVRRIYFQLIGLPPSVQQVEAFVADERPDAYEQLVDQLLNSPHFGERWGRHWLDLARYADSNGLDENFLFREAWRYRNWVIDAVNADLPFDRFVLEQIAGDLLPYDSIDQRDRQRIATGFLAIGPKVLLGNKEKNQRMEIADEQLDTIGRAILGQSLGCARCHDHKFDPIPTADYYSLAGILTSTQVMENRHMLGEQRIMERLVGLGDGGEESDNSYENYWRNRPTLQQRRDLATSALEFLKQGDEAALKKLLQENPEAVPEGFLDAGLTMQQRIDAQAAYLTIQETLLASPPPIPARAMVSCDREQPADEFIRVAGQFDRLGDSVPRGFLRVLSNSPANIPPGQSGRIELAKWLMDADHGAGQLAARVLANRVWLHMIGSGIVRTADNLGRTGEAPSHPELLDHLASELIESGWSIKELVRQVALSRTFMMSSNHNDANYAVDPDNRLLWRAHRRRLDPESLRDAMQSAAGQLDVRPMDSSVWYLDDQATAVGDNKNRRRTDFPCRSVYLPVIRNDLPELFDVFNFADPHATTGMRPETMVATQSLFILNDDSVMAAAEATARRALAERTTDETMVEQVDTLIQLVLNHSITDRERDELVPFIEQMQQRLTAEGEPNAELRAWSMACHALLASSRFQILE